MNTTHLRLARHAPLWQERYDAPTFTARNAPARVLIAEDESVQSLLITLMLKHHGVESTVVTDGQQALKAMKADIYDLVLMDYRMPVLNGIEATRAIRKWERERGYGPTPIVAVTAGAMASECDAYRKAGMNDVILKPFSARALAEVLARHGLTQPLRAFVHGAVS